MIPVAACCGRLSIKATFGMPQLRAAGRADAIIAAVRNEVSSKVVLDSRCFELLPFGSMGA
jgi:hypothetical protein